MGMLAVVEIVDLNATDRIFEEVFDYLVSADERFSTYKKNSEITLFNEGKKIDKKNLSTDMKEVLELSEETKKTTNGFFDITRNGKIDPSGLVKGWAIRNASLILRDRGFENFYVEIAGDIEVAGLNSEGKKWAIGVRNPFNKTENVKVVYLSESGIATSGTYERGGHIYNPKQSDGMIGDDVVSLTVIGPNIYEADRFATAAFAMGKDGILFIEKLPGFEGYMIDKDGVATLTTGFEKYT